jgi:hypothetical protein
MVESQEMNRPIPSPSQPISKIVKLKEISEEMDCKTRDEISKNTLFEHGKSLKRGSLEEPRDLVPKSLKLDPISPSAQKWSHPRLLKSGFYLESLGGFRESNRRIES